MGKPSKRIMDFMAKWGVDSDEVWEVRTGGSWAIKHSAVERIAAQAGIVFDRPAIIESNSKDGTVCVCVFGKLGERTEWSFGEANPKNCKIAYPYSIAEKRGKDRTALKLLNASHGELYSEDEADDFKEPAKRQNPHVTRAEDVAPLADEDFMPIQPNAPTMKVKDAKHEYTMLLDELERFDDYHRFMTWVKDPQINETVNKLPTQWRDIFRSKCQEMRDSLRDKIEQDAAE